MKRIAPSILAATVRIYRNAEIKRATIEGHLLLHSQKRVDPPANTPESFGRFEIKSPAIGKVKLQRNQPCAAGAQIVLRHVSRRRRPADRLASRQETTSHHCRPGAFAVSKGEDHTPIRTSGVHGVKSKGARCDPISRSCWKTLITDSNGNI
jgi:hypothetical protein